MVSEDRRAEGDDGRVPLPEGVIATGFAEIDEVLGGGLRRGSLTVIGGHAGAGAAVLARQVACRAAAEQRVRVAYLAVGAQVADVERAAIAGHTGVRVSEIGHATAADRAAAVARIFDGRLEIDRLADRAREGVLSWAVGRASIGDTDVLVIDCLNLLGVVDADWTFPTSPPLDSPMMADVLRHLRVLALDRDLLVVVAADLPSVAATERGTTSDHLIAHRAALGPAAQIADSLLLLYRPDMWDRNDPRCGEADVVVAKAPYCHVPTAVTLAHQLHLGRFVSMRQ